MERVAQFDDGVGKNGQISSVCVRFWGFGESAKGEASKFQISSYVSMVHEFMDSLGIVSAPIAGHSMGGTVALSMALEHPETIERVGVVGSPIVGSTLNFFLKLAGYGWIANITWRFPILLSSIMHILLAGDSEQVQEMNIF